MAATRAAPRRFGARAATKSTRIVPVTAGRWPDLEQLFGEKGACAGCWCMWMRLPTAEFRRGKGAGNRSALRALVAKRPPGLIAYVGGEPAAPCFYIHRAHRGSGLTAMLLEAAAAYAKKQGARAIEGYPNVNRAERQPAAFVWSGFESTFKRAGFSEIARRSPTRPILRKALRRG